MTASPHQSMEPLEHRMESCTIKVPPPPAFGIKVIDESELGNVPSSTIMDENTISDQNETISADSNCESSVKLSNNAGDCKQCSLTLMYILPAYF